MSNYGTYIDKVMKILPEVCTAQDLVDIGIYRNTHAAWYARKNGIGPEFFKMPSRAIVYAKESVIDFLIKAKTLR